jgi:hypothetical protein
MRRTMPMPLLAQRLVPADQRRRRKAHEAERVRNAPRPVQLDHRLVDGDVEPALAYARVDDAEPAGHALNPGPPGS